MPRPSQRPTMITGLSHAAAIGAQAMAHGTPAPRQEAPDRPTIVELAADLRRQGVLPPRGAAAPKPPVAGPSAASRANGGAVGQSPAANAPTRDSGSQRATPAEPRFRRRDTATRAGDVVRFAGESGRYRLVPVNPTEKGQKP